MVVGNVIRRDNPEAQAVEGLNLPRLSLPEALNRFLVGDRQSLVVAGTHGKTTTTALLAWLLFATGRDPGFMVGGSPGISPPITGWARGLTWSWRGTSTTPPISTRRPKFVHFQPRTAILTSVEFDHADIYQDLDQVVAAFHTFLTRMPPGVPSAGLGGRAPGAPGVREIKLPGSFTDLMRSRPGRRRTSPRPQAA